MSADGHKIQLHFEDEFEDVQAKNLKDLRAKIAQRFKEIRTAQFNITFGEAGDFRIRWDRDFEEAISKAGDAPTKFNI